MTDYLFAAALLLVGLATIYRNRTRCGRDDDGQPPIIGARHL